MLGKRVGTGLVISAARGTAPGGVRRVIPRARALSQCRRPRVPVDFWLCPLPWAC